MIGHFEESITGLPLDVAVYHPLMQKEGESVKKALISRHLPAQS